MMILEIENEINIQLKFDYNSAQQVVAQDFSIVLSCVKVEMILFRQTSAMLRIGQ